MESNFSSVSDHLRWKTTQLLLISNMYFSKHAEYMNPVQLVMVLLLLVTGIHIIGISSMKNILQEKSLFFFSLSSTVFFLPRRSLRTFRTHHVRVPCDVGKQFSLFHRHLEALLLEGL